MRRTATPPRQEQRESVAAEEGTLPHSVHLQASTPLDATLQGAGGKAAPQLAWHPSKQRLLAASGIALVEYDALSGSRRNLVEAPGAPLRVAYTPSGGAVVLLTKERAIYAWGTVGWKRRVLLPPDPKYAGKKLAAGLLAISGGQHPIVYWTPLGKNTVRMVQTQPLDLPRGTKPEREQVPGVKLKTENRKPIVGLAAHPAERGTLFVLLADGSLQVWVVQGAAVATAYSLPISGLNATSERLAVHAWPHPSMPGAALVGVEGAASGVTVLEAPPRQEPRPLGTLSFGPGSVLCGVGLLSCGLLAAAGRLPSGNVQVQAWELLGDSRELQVLPTMGAPGTLWDALQSMAGKAALADVSGENVVARLHFHPPSGSVAVATALRGREGEAGHQRVPLLHLVDGADPVGVPRRDPVHSGLSFWSARDSSDAMVSKLRFPRYAHLLSAGRAAAYDLTHGMLSDVLALPPTNAAGQERRLVAAVRSAKQGAWLAFAKVVSRRREGAPLGPGQLEFSLVKDSEAALTANQWTLPGADGAFVGAADELVVVLSNSGRSLSVYETPKLAGGAAKPLYSAELKEGLVAAVYPGPPAHIPAPPTPAPPSAAVAADADSEDSDAGEDDAAIEARAEWEAAERRRLEPPRLVLLRTQSNQLVLAEVSPSTAAYSGKARVLPTRATLALRPGEAVVQVAWQPLVPADGTFHSGCEGAAGCVAAAAAVLTSQRLLVLNERLGVVASAGLPPDMGLPASCLWLGPALLVSTSAGQVLQVCWDGKLVHLCSLLGGGLGAPALLGALADRLLIATRATATGRAEVGSRAISVLQPLLLGWASLAQRRLVPGGADRVRRELLTLVASYDASQLGAPALERLAAAGFPDVAAAVAARSDSPAITPAHKAVLQAAAGDWQPLLLLVMGEWEASAYHPKPPPRASPLYARMVALARACLQYGRFRDARRLLEAAGASGELLALCVFQGDFPAVQEAARTAGRDVERLADQLLAVNENAFVHGSADRALYGGRPNIDDWAVAAGASAGGLPAAARHQAAPADDGTGLDGDAEGPSAAAAATAGASGTEELEIEVAPAGRLPFQEASLQVLSAADPPPGAAAAGDEGAPIEGLDLGTLEAYVGVAGATVVKPAVSTPTAAAAGAAAAMLGAAAGGGAAALGRTETGLSDVSHIEALEAAPAGSTAAVERDETAAQAAARAEFRRDTADDEDDFFSSDEESAPTEADSRSVTSLATASAAGSRFKIAIRPAEEAAATPRGGDASALRAAAQSLRLGGPPSTADSTPSTSALPSARSTSGPALRASSSGALAKPGLLAPPPAAASSKASSVSGEAAAPAAAAAAGPAAAAAVVDDPFADLFGGLGSSGGQPSKPAPAAPATAAAPAAASSGPMRPPPPAKPAVDLLSGWDDFEALFAADSKPGAQQGGAAALAGAAAGAGAFEVSFPPPPGAAAAAPAAPAPGTSPPKPSAAAAAAAAAAGASEKPSAAAAPPAGAALKKSGSVSELAPAAAKKAAEEGLRAFAGGRWEAAADKLGKALDKGAKAGDAAFTEQASGGALALYVAARLLAAGAKKPAPTAARLARFAVALPLEEGARVAAVAAAVDANMAAKNFGYAADQLTWLVIKSTEGGAASGLNAMELQDKLNACDRAGASNASLPRDEDRDSFAAIVASCGGRRDAEDLVAEIAAGA